MTRGDGAPPDSARRKNSLADTAVAKVCGANGIAVAPGGEGLREELIEVCANILDFLVIEDPTRFEVATAIKGGALCASQGAGVGHCGRVEPQVTLDLFQMVDLRDEWGNSLKLILPPYGAVVKALIYGRDSAGNPA